MLGVLRKDSQENMKQPNPYTQNMHLQSVRSGGDIACSSNATLTSDCSPRSKSILVRTSCIPTTPSQASQMIENDEKNFLSDADTDKLSQEDNVSSATLLNESQNSNYQDVGLKLKAELSKYKKELKLYNNTTKDLEEKYMKINYELNEMQQKHDRFVASRTNVPKDSESFSSSSSSTSSSEYSLQRKFTQVFHRGNSYMTLLPNVPKSSNEHIKNKQDSEIEPMMPMKRQKQPFTIPPGHQLIPRNKVLTRRRARRKNVDINGLDIVDDKNDSDGNKNTASLKDIYNILCTVLHSNQKQLAAANQPAVNAKQEPEVKELKATITNLQTEQAKFRNIIHEQQTCLNDYHSRCLKAQHFMQTQQIEIDKLSSNNHQLESEITKGIDNLRTQIDAKLRDVSHLPQMIREEQSKYEKALKENGILTDKLRKLQNEAAQLKAKLEEMSRRKVATVNRLKAAERDLKIFKNYNASLKQEKRRLTEELDKLRDQLAAIQTTNKRTLSRQREANEKQRRELQKRVFELELKLSRSQNSTSNLIQERDSLIAELQTQLNTLVHNFEVSQKHIRVLRRHIYSMSGSNASATRVLGTIN